MKQFLIIQLIAWLGWLSCIALAQPEFTGEITGSVSFPAVGITCIANLAVSVTSFLRRRLDLEMGARDFLATITAHCKLNEIKGDNYETIGLTTTAGGQEGYRHASVVMLSNYMSNSSIRQFMKYFSNAPEVRCILLKFLPLKSALESASVSTKIRECSCESASAVANKCISRCDCEHCNCIVFSTVEDITSMLARQMPRVLIIVGDSLCLLPSQQCRNKGCHGCNHKMVVDGNGNQVEMGHFYLDFSAPACDALDFDFTTPVQKDPVSICIPVNLVSGDSWTKLLLRSFKSKDQEDKGDTVMASDALESYLARGREDRQEAVFYRPVLTIVPRLVEIFINLLLTGLFKVDGFSSSMAARRATRNYVTDSKGNRLPANAFLTSALVVVQNNSVCQVLKFRGDILGSRTLLCIVGFVNVFCSIAWAVVLIAFNGGAGKWYEIPSVQPSKGRVAVIIAAIGFGIAMDCFEFSKLVRECCEIAKDSRGSKSSSKEIWKEIIKKKRFMVLAVIVLELGFAVVAGALGLNEGIGRWVYVALQVLVWVKWGIGSYLLGPFSPEYVPTRATRTSKDGRVILGYSSAEWVDEGTLVYSSSFFLNAVLAGVLGNWAAVWSNGKVVGG